MNRKHHPAQSSEAENSTPAEATGEDTVVVEDTDTARQIDRLLAEKDRAEQERDEYLTLAQRVKADFENYKRRNQNTREDAYNEGVCDTLVKLLPVLDNLDRAAASEGGEASLREGVQLVVKQFCSILAGSGVEEIKADGCAFDPNLHHAVLQEAVEGRESGCVVGVLQKGYARGEKVLRHCMVKVAE